MTAEIAARLALIRAGIIIAKYDPDQARDDHGRWTTGGVHVLSPDAGGKSVTPPPAIGGGAANPRYQARANKLHAMAVAGDAAGVKAELDALAAKVAESANKLKQNSHDRWYAKLHAYANTLHGELLGGTSVGGQPPPPPPPPPPVQPPAVSPPPPPVMPPQPPPGMQSSKPMLAEFPKANIESQYSTTAKYIATNKAKLDKLPPDHLGLLQHTKLIIAGSMKGYNAAGLFSPSQNRVSLGKAYVDSDEVLYHEFGHALDRALQKKKDPSGMLGTFAATRDPLYGAAVAEEHANLIKQKNNPDKNIAWEAKSLSHFTTSKTESFAQGYAALYAPHDSKESRVLRTRRLMPKTIQAVRDFLGRQGLTVPPLPPTPQSIPMAPPPSPAAVVFPSQAWKPST